MAVTLDGTNGVTAPGTETFGDGTALGGATNPIVSMAKGANNYVQSYIVNNTNGASSSADVVAYPSNGADAHGWIDIGITSLSYADAVYTVTGPNESYLFGSAPTASGTTGNLVYATDNTGTANSHQWYVGGFTQAKGAWKMQLTSTGLQLANALGVAYGGTGATTLAGAGIPSVSTANTFTALQTFTGSTSVLATALTNAGEVATVSATAATGTINYDVTTQSVIYYTSSAAANWTVNFRGSSGTSLNTLMAVGQSVTVAFLVTQGATAYYNNVVQIDGTTVTPKYQGGTAWAAGNASGIDSYVYTIIKTAASTYTVLASQTQFK
jgi:hypothetical protein